MHRNCPKKYYLTERSEINPSAWTHASIRRFREPNIIKGINLEPIFFSVRLCAMPKTRMRLMRLWRNLSITMDPNHIDIKDDNEIAHRALEIPTSFECHPSLAEGQANVNVLEIEENEDDDELRLEARSPPLVERFMAICCRVPQWRHEEEREYKRRNTLTMFVLVSFLWHPTTWCLCARILDIQAHSLRVARREWNGSRTLYHSIYAPDIARLLDASHPRACPVCAAWAALALKSVVQAKLWQPVPTMSESRKKSAEMQMKRELQGKERREDALALDDVDVHQQTRLLPASFSLYCLHPHS
ncbi:hypothetical protein C8R45DRAFT_1130627 [Mycena sanguinolenta]|nr:hypothetical protein C8R45DRAFT_1130627 [Mycena sanguinolenta]